MSNNLVVCIGNELAADDGIGSAVYRGLQIRGTALDAQLVHAGLAGLELLELFDGQDTCVIVDAAKFGDPPGAIREWTFDVQRALGPSICSHDIGLVQALSIGRQLMPHRLPRRGLVITVEGERFDELGVGLSRDVAAAIPAVVELVADRVNSKGVSHGNRSVGSESLCWRVIGGPASRRGSTRW